MIVLSGNSGENIHESEPWKWMHFDFLKSVAVCLIVVYAFK